MGTGKFKVLLTVLVALAAVSFISVAGAQDKDSLSAAQDSALKNTDEKLAQLDGMILQYQAKLQDKNVPEDKAQQYMQIIQELKNLRDTVATAKAKLKECKDEECVNTQTNVLAMADSSASSLATEAAAVDAAVAGGTGTGTGMGAGAGGESVVAETTDEAAAEEGAAEQADANEAKSTTYADASTTASSPGASPPGSVAVGSDTPANDPGTNDPGTSTDPGGAVGSSTTPPPTPNPVSK